MSFKFGKSSIDKLKGVHPALVAVTWLALKKSMYDFGISEGVRTKEKQEEYFTSGKSLTMNSKHLTGHAIDFVVYVGGKVTWDLKRYKKVAEAFKQAGEELGVEVTWGGDWKNLVDGPHIQIDPKVWK